MSYCHLVFLKIKESAELVQYEIVTTDFSRNNEDEIVGIATIILNGNTFEFKPAGSWIDQKIYPPKVFMLSDEARKKKTREYTDYYCATWARGVCEALMERIGAHTFPDKFTWVR